MGSPCEHLVGDIPGQQIYQSKILLKVASGSFDIIGVNFPEVVSHKVDDSMIHFRVELFNLFHFFEVDLLSIHPSPNFLEIGKKRFRQLEVIVSDIEPSLMDNRFREGDISVLGESISAATFLDFLLINLKNLVKLLDPLIR